MQFSSTNYNGTNNRILFAICLLLAVLLLGFTFFETLVDLNTLWQLNNEAFSHGYLVLGLVLYALYERRDLLVLKPTLSVLPFALLAGLAWTAANTINVKLGEYLILPFVLLLLITSAVGWKKSQHFVLPISALYFALPIVGYVNPVLQTMTVKVVTAMVRMTDMVAHIDGFYITLPYGVLHVADSCSGLSYLSAGITFTMLYAFLNIRRKRLKALSVGFMITLSLLANWIRVFILVAIGHESQMQSSLVKEHGFLGWVIFAFAFTLFLLVMRKVENRFDHHEVQSTVEKQAPRNHAGSPLTYLKFTSPLTVAFTVSLIPLLALSVKEQHLSQGIDQSTLAASFSSAQISDYQHEDSVSFVNADNTIKIQNKNGEYPFSAYIVIYNEQYQGKELIYYKNKVGQNLNLKGRINISDFHVNYAVEETTNTAVFWFYKVGNTTELTSWKVKLAQLRNLFSNTGAAAFIVKVPCKAFASCAQITETNELAEIIHKLSNIELR